MNLFILSLKPKEIAQDMMDKHVHKILLEAVQMLCTAKRILDPEDRFNEHLYRASHVNHPVSVWCRASRANFVWTLELVEELHAEWKFRYGHPASKQHKSYVVAAAIRDRIPDASKFKQQGLTPFALAMPEQYKAASGDAVESYRAYYMSPDKQKIATWKKKREAPHWYQRVQ